MNYKTVSVFLLWMAGLVSLGAVDASRRVVLNETGVKNLRIETQEVEETNFEETFFAIGRIAVIPERHAVLSSRIGGRAIALEAQEGDIVKAGQILVKVESRQPGNPPPTVELMSPIGGLVMESHVRLGEPVEPNKELMDISDLHEVYAIARVPEHYAAQLKPGSKAHILVSALGDGVIDGEMLRFGTSADEASGTIDAIFRVPNPELKMRPNMRAEFSVVLSERKNVMSVPKSAVQGDLADRFVFVRDFELPNAFVKCPVVVGQSNDRYVEIVRGLFPGDEVVTRGAYSLSVGGGTVSLAEALDAAHGHKHAPDGSELGEGGAGEHPDHDGEHAHGHSGWAWKALSGLLFLLLIACLVFRKNLSAA